MHSDSGQTLTWHEDCLQCSVCQVKVQLDNVVFSDKLFCRSCYIETNLNKCDKCSKVGVYYCIVIQCHLYFFYRIYFLRLLLGLVILSVASFGTTRVLDVIDAKISSKMASSEF